MKRRDFFKGLAGVIAGFAIVPIVVIKETPNEWEKALRKVTDYESELMRKTFYHSFELEFKNDSWVAVLKDGWNYQDKRPYEYIHIINKD